MRTKQIRKYADEIMVLERIHKNPESSPEEIAKAEKRIIQIANQISCLPGGMDILAEIDTIIQQKI